MKCPDCNGACVMSETPLDEFPDYCDTCQGTGEVDNYISHGSTLTNTQLTEEDINGLRKVLGDALNETQLNVQGDK